ncbi:MAG: nuclear transport factor 2 family protein [Ginsengibacter sp.]
MIKYFFLLSATSVILFACGADTNKQAATNDDSLEMAQHKKDERNKSIALKCIRAYAAHDSEFILANNANDVVNIYGDQPPIHGIDSCRIVLRQAFNTIKEYKPGYQHALADSNYVFVFLYADASYKKETADHAKMVEIFKFNDVGKIIMHTAVYEALDSNSVRRSL